MLKARRPAPAAASASSSTSAVGADGAPLKPASPADIKELKRLCQVIVRMFYEDQAIMVIDQLAKFEVIDAVMLARRLAVGTKDLKAQCQKLLEDRLLSVHSRFEQPERDPNKPPPPPEFKQRMIKRTYYYLDLATFFSVVKWRVLQIYKSIDSLTSSVAALTKRGYLCPQCGKTFDSFDVAHLLDVSTNALRCDVPGCFTELELDEDKETAKRKEDKMQSFNQQFGRIMAGLRKLEGLALPEMNVDAWLAVNGSVAPTLWKAYDINDDEVRALAAEVAAMQASDPSGEKSKASTKSSGAELAIAKGATNSATLGGLQVDVSAVLDPASEAARMKAADEAARRKRAQNALPEWHLASTVSGDATALGLAEQRRRAAAGVDTSAEDAAAAAAQAAGADPKDATAAYYASLGAGGDEEDDEDEEEEFIEVEEQSPLKRAAPADSSGPSTPRAGDASKKARLAGEGGVPMSSQASVAASSSAPTGTGADKGTPRAPAEEDEEEEEEFEEV